MPNSDDVSRSAFLLYHVSTCVHIYTRCNWSTGPLIILSLIMPEKEIREYLCTCVQVLYEEAFSFSLARSNAVNHTTPGIKHAH